MWNELRAESVCVSIIIQCLVGRGQAHVRGMQTRTMHYGRRATAQRGARKAVRVRSSSASGAQYVDQVVGPGARQSAFEAALLATSPSGRQSE